MTAVTIRTTEQILAVIDKALEEKDMSDAELQRRAKLSNSYICSVRRGSGNMATKNFLSILDALNLRLVVEKKWARPAVDPMGLPRVSAPQLAPQPAGIEDMKVEQFYGWGYDGNGDRVWTVVSYKILIKKAGQWSELRVDHINPQPPREDAA